MDWLNLDDNREIYREFMEALEKQTPTKKAAATATPEEASVCYTAESLPAKMSYSDVETMAFHLALQLNLLEARDCSLLFWQPSDVLVVNKKLYLLANLLNLVPIMRKTNKIVLTYPAVFPFPQAACAPELLKIKGLPFITHKSLSYYSLALLCLQKLNLSLEDLPSALQGTKLFYFLERCLKEEPCERALIHL